MIVEEIKNDGSVSPFSFTGKNLKIITKNNFQGDLVMNKRGGIISGDTPKMKLSIKSPLTIGNSTFNRNNSLSSNQNSQANHRSANSSERNKV